jgi:tellurite resistance protein TerC
VGTPLLWAGFLAAVSVFIFIDLRLSAGKPVAPAAAAAWTGVWVTLSLAFAGFLYMLGGTQAAVPFLTAYVVEYALSVDNLFVFLVIFSFFKVPATAQHRLLYWGIIGAFTMRGGLIFLGTALVSKFEWVLYFFGAFLLYTAWRLLRAGDDEGVDPEQSRVLQLARRVLPVSRVQDTDHFFALEDGARKVTPLFLTLLVVETSDLLFALDSIPAVLAISQDPFIVFTSNACAILGLRSLFFLVSSLMKSFRFLKVGLSVILAFVGVKLIAETAYSEWAHHHEDIVITISLSFIVLTLVASVVASLLIPERKAPVEEAPRLAVPPADVPEAKVQAQRP